MSIFKKQNITSEVMYQLLENDHLAPLVGDFAEFGLVKFGEALESPMDDIELDSTNVLNHRAEANALAAALAEMAVVTEEMNVGGFKDIASIEKIGPMLDLLAATEIIGPENTEDIFAGVLTSPRITSITKLDQETSKGWVDSINARAKLVGYQVALKEFCDTLRELENMYNQNMYNQ